MLYHNSLRLFVTAVILVFCLNASAQSRDSLQKRGYFINYTSVMGGLVHGAGFGPELGISKMTIGMSQSGLVVSEGVSASSEYYFGSQPLMVPKISAWIASGFAFGLTVADYTDFHQSSLVFRPSVGIGGDGVNIMYGRNIKLTNTAFDRIGRDVFSIDFNISFHQRKGKSYARLSK